MDTVLTIKGKEVRKFRKRAGRSSYNFPWMLIKKRIQLTAIRTRQAIALG